MNYRITLFSLQGSQVTECSSREVENVLMSYGLSGWKQSDQFHDSTVVITIEPVPDKDAGERAIAALRTIAGIAENT